MLQESDLDTFFSLYQRVSNEQSSLPLIHPADALQADEEEHHQLQSGDLTALSHAMKIACGAGDAAANMFYVFDKIARSLEEQQLYVDLRRPDAWECAIRWALREVATSGPDVPELHESDRRLQVGMACRRLRDRGYVVPVGAFGPSIATGVRQKIVDKVCSLVSRVGGFRIAHQLCAVASGQGKVHDGYWTFGTPVTKSFREIVTPALPIGWLFSLAIRYCHVPASSIDSAADWDTLANLATDFASSLDCQRYSVFEAINLHPHEFVSTLEDLFEWREVFSLPQVPPMTIPVLRQALLSAAWPLGTQDINRDVKRLLFESADLLSRSVDDGLTVLHRAATRRRYPRLWRHATAKPGEANAGYREPLDADKRTQDQLAFFETGNDDVLVLPRPFTTSAVCHVVFGLIRKRMERQDADKFVGETLENAIRISCEGKTESLNTNVEYSAGKNEPLEIDAAARSDGVVILFEAKSKTLTIGSRSGDALSLVGDYTKSYLSLVQQLVRHEGNLRRGLIPITTSDDDLNRIHVRMVAVSPLSYGPASDPTIGAALVRAIVGAHLTTTQSDERSVRIVREFSKKIKNIESELSRADPGGRARIDIPGYFTNVMWLDLGQLVYLLSRCRSANQALERNLTSGSGDFWTETAFLDRGGLLSRR